MSDNESIRPERRTSLIAKDDMRVGLAGEYALCRWLHGDVRPWIEQREALITYGHHDDGCDCPGYAVDVKCSERRFGIKPEHHHLIVERRIIKLQWHYVLALLEGDEVLLMGYEDSFNLLSSFYARRVSVWHPAIRLKQLPEPEEAREQWSTAK